MAGQQLVPRATLRPVCVERERGGVVKVAGQECSSSGDITACVCVEREAVVKAAGQELVLGRHYGLCVWRERGGGQGGRSRVLVLITAFTT